MKRSQGNSFPSQLFYRGSDEQYDYYVVQDGLKHKDFYRVLRTENDQPDRMSVASDAANWRDVQGANYYWQALQLKLETQPATGAAINRQN
ncbi:MAG TPA: hypothetical protein VM008_17420 [Phycisphaerae bacterium]|nr:hypothetical protein [Phycisphaerae bacterium]